MSIDLEHNLRLMRKALSELDTESMGRGVYREGNITYPKAAANFSYELDTGKIIQFGNIQFLPKDLQERIAQGLVGEGMFKVAMNLKASVLPKIVEVVYGVKTSVIAQRLLNASTAEYNANIGW